MSRQLLALIAASALSYAATADDLRELEMTSGDLSVALIELYTSEGCSSCPPADRWLSNLKSDGRLWKDFVPIALHVDYWNSIGWTDRFSDASFTRRQREYVRNGGARVSYTPGFFKNGQEWRDWFVSESPDTQREAVGNLSLGVNGNLIAVRFDPLTESSQSLVVNIAILGMQLESDIQAGENNGKRLRHDFVALNVQSVPMRQSGDSFIATTELDAIETETDTLALVAWVSAENNQTPIQSVGGYLPKN